MKHKSLWTIASAVETQYREASFGGGRPSSSMNIHNLCWDPANEAFVRGDLYGWGSGNSWNWRSYPCHRDFAEVILNLCRTNEVQSRFLGNMFSREEDSELYLRGGYAVNFLRSAAIPGHGMRYLALASCSFRFFSPDGVVQCVSLNAELSQHFSRKLRDESPETINDALTKVRVAA